MLCNQAWRTCSRNTWQDLGTTTLRSFWRSGIFSPASLRVPVLPKTVKRTLIFCHYLESKFWVISVRMNRQRQDVKADWSSKYTGHFPLSLCFWSERLDRENPIFNNLVLYSLPYAIWNLAPYSQRRLEFRKLGMLVVKQEAGRQLGMFMTFRVASCTNLVLSYSKLGNCRIQ